MPLETENPGWVLQRQTRKLINEFIQTQNAAYYGGGLDRIIEQQAFFNIEDRLFYILMDELDKALASNDEYGGYPIAVLHLHEVFSDPDMLSVRDGKIQINAERIAGSQADFDDGVRSARERLKLGKLKKRSARNFWKTYIYKPYREGIVPKGKLLGKPQRGVRRKRFDWLEYASRKYPLTIQVRMEEWGTHKAPYWILLDKGNVGKRGAYPHNQATNFIYSATLRLNNVYEFEKSEVSSEYASELEREINRFLANPEEYEPGYIFDTIEQEGKRYSIYVTRTKRLGVALRPRY